MINISIDHKRAILNGRLQQLALNHYECTVDLKLAKAINDPDQIAIVQNNLYQFELSCNTVQSMLNELDYEKTIQL